MPPPSREGRHRPAFVLVHGAWHDAEVWDALRTALDRHGAVSAAVNLPSDDVTVDASGYAAFIAATCRQLAGDDAILVGHSLAGIALPLVPALTPVRRLIYLGALIPAPGERMNDVQARERPLGDTRALARDADGRTYWSTPAAAIHTLYHDCDPDQACQAAARLRPQARTPHAEPCPLERFPDVPASYIVMRDDRMVRPDWSRQAAVQRLGVDPIELPGGHSPMLAQPEELARTLLTLSAS